MDLTECKETGIVRITRIDSNFAHSLLEMSDIKEKTAKKATLDNLNVNAYFPMAYDALREILEAYCLLFGYKVGNHDCLGKLMKELLSTFDLFLFDRFRYVRNGINYYGKKVGLEEGNLLIEKMFLMKKEIVIELKKKLGEIK
ncbi:hypothetical protein HZA99_05505 [Candidatus Woesearchaeota archaeon]|nr:hypothetical protein [Candidatus Woesearchaeota archaeon]